MIYRLLSSDSLRRTHVKVPLPIKQLVDFLKKSDAVKKSIDELYEQASGANSFIGADIRTFIGERLEYYLEPDDSYRNILLLITDGYWDFKPGYDGDNSLGVETKAMYVEKFRGPGGLERFRKEGHGLLFFDHLDLSILDAVFVLEITKRDPMEDLPIIKFYITTFFENMGVDGKNIKFMQSTQTFSIIENSIRRAIE